MSQRIPFSFPTSAAENDFPPSIPLAASRSVLVERMLLRIEMKNESQLLKVSLILSCGKNTSLIEMVIQGGCFGFALLTLHFPVSDQPTIQSGRIAGWMMLGSFWNLDDNDPR